MKDFFSNWIVRNLLLAAVLITVLALVANFLLSSYTRHGDTLVTPDFSGMDAVQAAKVAKRLGLSVLVVDSINVKGVAAGCVVKQEPKEGDKVKKGRRIRLTINAKMPKMLPMPNLIGFSLRSAAAELSARGMNLDKLVYVNDMATNNVLQQYYRGRPVAPGTLVPGESDVTLYLGLSEDDNQTLIPDLAGLNYKTAVQRLHDASLNVDKMIFERSVRTYLDTMSCVVQRQFPEHSQASVLMGTKVTLWFKRVRQ